MSPRTLWRPAVQVILAGVLLLPLIVLAQGAGPQIDVSTVPRDSAGRIVIRREVFSYASGGRRDPFASLITTGDMRPLLADLEVVSIILDPAGRNSVATLKDRSTTEIYSVRTGSVVGRIRVTAIRQREIALAIDEFGFTRQEILAINVPQRGQRTP